MHHLLSIVALLGLFALPTMAHAQELALKRVMLSSGGLGYFEYEATVDGDATLKLTVSLQQVDDVLKSLVVYDDKGGVGGLSLPGREPLANTFKDLPFDQDSLASPADLLATLKGAEVSVGGGRSMTGRIVSVQEDTVALNEGKTTFKRTRVTLLTDRGLQQFILEDAENLQFTDAGLRDKVGAARILAVLEPRSNTMKAGVMKDRLAVSLEQADRVYCYAANLGWDAAVALAPLGTRLRVETDLPQLVEAIVAEARPGDQVLVMSNGGFGGIHEKLLKALLLGSAPQARA